MLPIIPMPAAAGHAPIDLDIPSIRYVPMFMSKPPDSENVLIESYM